jgi:hypothetical protein
MQIDPKNLGQRMKKQSSRELPKEELEDSQQSVRQLRPYQPMLDQANEI